MKPLKELMQEMREETEKKSWSLSRKDQNADLIRILDALEEAHEVIKMYSQECEYDGGSDAKDYLDKHGVVNQNSFGEYVWEEQTFYQFAGFKKVNTPLRIRYDKVLEPELYTEIEPAYSELGAFGYREVKIKVRKYD